MEGYFEPICFYFAAFVLIVSRKFRTFRCLFIRVVKSGSKTNKSFIVVGKKLGWGLRKEGNNPAHYNKHQK